MNLRARDIISAARVRIQQKHIYMGSSVMSLRMVEMPGLGTMATNVKWQCGYDPVVVEKWGAIGTAAVIFHEVQHPLREHFERFNEWVNSIAVQNAIRAFAAQQGMTVEEVTAMLRLMLMFNVAGDAEINDEQDRAGWPLPATDGEQMVRAGQFGAEDGELAETYANILLERALAKMRAPEPQQGPEPQGRPGHPGAPGQGEPQQGQPGQPRSPHGQPQGEPTSGQPEPGTGTPGCGGTCGCCDGTAKDGWDKDLPADAPEGMDKVEADLVRRQTAQDIVDHIAQHGRGTVPGGLATWAEKHIAPPKVDWRKRLAALVKNAIAIASGANDYTYQRRSRRQVPMHVALGERCPIMPGLSRPVPVAKLVLDTSQSMDGGAGEMALSELMGIVKALGVPCEVIAVDAAVHAVARIAAASDLSKVTIGGGGTDMRVGIAKAAEDGKANVIIVLTDGYTPWPEQNAMPRKARLVACVIGEPEVPDHITAVVRVPLKED